MTIVLSEFGEMIALHCHPFSIVNDEGFINLIRQLEPLPSRRYITEKVATKIYVDMKEKVSTALSVLHTLQLYDRQYVVNMCVSNESFLSLTAHWITADTFQRVCYVELRAPTLGVTSPIRKYWISRHIITMAQTWLEP